MLKYKKIRNNKVKTIINTELKKANLEGNINSILLESIIKKYY